MTSSETKFHSFHTDISNIALPQKFTYPFFYEPHPLSILAAEQVQKYIETQQDFVHNFGMDPNHAGLEIGKMFGVLVVQNTNKQLGFLAAFSGKIANSNDHHYFVPPVYDTLKDDEHFNPTIAEINKINDQVTQIENSDTFAILTKNEQEVLARNEEKLKGYRNYCAQQKSLRDELRKAFAPQKESTEYQLLDAYLQKQSIRDNYELKQLQKIIKEENAQAQKALEDYNQQLNELKNLRKEKSAWLQDIIFQHYIFLNKDKEQRSIYQLFNKDLGIEPLAGTGECAAPKLFQYAFQHDLKPICMAEFWWGKSPKSEIRKHQHFYPSCRGKCEPILRFMLGGIDMDEDVLRLTTPKDCTIDILYEDEYMAVINKPNDFLSVPGKYMEDTVYSRMRNLYPDATGPLVVHRLDMATSGIMLIAKDKYTHKLLQKQFIKKTIQKRYVAILDGELKEQTGQISLPLRVDFNDRPRQLVDFENGRWALTKYEVIAIENGKTRIHFWPVTGRTHQLRMHASHALGLNMPIVGDEFYGTRAERLFLHAEHIEFIHPNTKQKMEITSPAPF